MEEANVNLSLPPVSTAFATVYGTVTDGTNPIPDATVKLFDQSGTPYRHTLTDATGNYVMDNIPVGTYSLAAVQTGYLLSESTGVTLSSGDTTQINLVCTADATLALGVIAGTAYVLPAGGVGTPLAGVKVSLLSATGTVEAITYTVDDGEFAFYDLADGVYTLLASAEGYLSTGPTTVTITGGSLSNVVLNLTVDSRTYNGTVSGTIRDQEGNVVAGCFVGLYQVTGEGTATTETLLAATKTNATGNYLFGGVVEGRYLVKAKLNQ